MSLESRPSDTFTKDNLLIGFSVVEFTPTGGTPVQLGILSGEELQKEVETLTLERGDSGTLTVDRELISKIEVTMQLEVFNFRADIAELIFGSTSGVVVSADAAASVVNDPFTIPDTGAEAERSFIGLSNGDIDEATFIGSSVTCAPRTDEAVGTGDGTTGSTTGDFSLDYKPLVIGDVTSVTVGGVSYDPVTAATSTALECVLVVGTGSTSGDMHFVDAAGTPINVTGAIVATYTPSHAFANLTDYVVDPARGRIRMLNVNGASDALKGGQPMLADYSYNRRATTNLKPFTNTQVDGSCTIKHLTDIGVNFVWTIPSATILITDDALTFGAEEFGTATLALNINDAGGSDRFGTMELASETEANA